MRISCDKDDVTGYAMWKELGEPYGRTDIYLNEVKQKKVVTADEEEGFIERCVTDANGNAVINRLNDCIQHEKLHGVVRIEIRSRS